MTSSYFINNMLLIKLQFCCNFFLQLLYNNVVNSRYLLYFIHFFHTILDFFIGYSRVKNWQLFQVKFMGVPICDENGGSFSAEREAVEHNLPQIIVFTFCTWLVNTFSSSSIFFYFYFISFFSSLFYSILFETQ